MTHVGANVINGLRRRAPVRKRVLLTRRLHRFALDELAERYDVTIHPGAVPMPRSSLISGIAGADGLVCFPYDVIDREVIDAAPNLRVISTYSVGYDHIDVRYAKKRRITIGYTPHVLTGATADLAVALMLDLMRRVTEGDRRIRSGAWTETYGPDDYLGSEIAGKTLGILGMGRIGTQVARRAGAFGMSIIYNSRREVDGAPGTYVTLERLLAESDVLSIHVPSTPDTAGMIDAGRIGTMKRTAFIVNTARGSVIDEPDLVRALENGTIAGAALDVFGTEPIDGQGELARMDNVVLTPHIGSSTDRTRADMARIAVENLIRGLEGKSPVYCVE